ncbi:MAG: SGNH/GDSL hydrolase family protein [Candidatus Pedobacter colombiensis]|uniref:SGNH/GDSL hydrolase family protein n=1 Tax=Candidatus Pedobacter colombiensis TaxID=3121371 RepID=A0AAJ5W878_9SPHI|nr:SGNH/GDSL hydrolase family protein [Pedobacter sp.]WEK19764.1 MAG: SGNH/GDSL hydrolase family protein [Pedobacter sp.]
MNSTYFYKSALALAILGLASCKPSIETFTPSKGTADFTRYIAIGNSLTAGYADGGLYLEGQQNSFPGMIAEQMKAVGGGSFSTPFFPADKANGTGYLKLTALVNGVPTITTETSNLAIVGQVGAVTLYTKYTGEINNYGVPGIRLVDARTPGYANANGLYERLLTGAYGTNPTAYLDFATAKPWTFFSNWLGNNDILGYASAGATGTPPTDKALFTREYNAVIDKLTSTGAKGVVATIPNVTSTAYFNTVTLQTLLAAINATPAGANVKDIYIQPGVGTPRAATAGDLFILPLSSAGVIGVPNGLGIPYGLDPRNPVESKYVLDMGEVLIVNDYIASYNNTIKSIANAKGLAIMDAYALLNEYAKGREVNGIPISGAFIQGNLFSLDGIHLTPLGYAITANAFISAINAKYGSSIPIVDVTRYRGVKYP